MSNDNDPIIRASDLRRVLEAMREDTSQNPIAARGYVLHRNFSPALAALPQREAAHMSECPPDCPGCDRAAPEVSAAPHEGEPPLPVGGLGHGGIIDKWVDYARHWRERAERAEADAAKAREAKA